MEKQVKISFVTGGVRSGKSSYAEKLAIDLTRKEGKRLYYIATARITDDEMKERVNRHRLIRENQPVSWQTMECPTNVNNLSRNISHDAIVLLDCLTTLVSNELFQGSLPLTMDKQQKIQMKLEQDIIQLAKACGTLIIVSNEVTYEAIDDLSVFLYCLTLNRLHAFIVQNGKEAYLVENGIVRRKKGERV